jgi:hypothetical protein
MGRRRCSIHLRLTTALSNVQSFGGLTSHLFLTALSCGHAHEACDIETEKPWSGCVLIPGYVRATKQNGLSWITTLRHSVSSQSIKHTHSCVIVLVLCRVSRIWLSCCSIIAITTSSLSTSTRVLLPTFRNSRSTRFPDQQ